MSIRSLSERGQAEALIPWLGGMAAVVMLALLAWLGANIFWTLNSPESARPSALMETDLARAQQTITNRHLFGLYVVAAGPAIAPSNLKLSGVIAAQKAGQRAYALITVEGKPAQLVKEGEEVATGITLQRVLSRQVELMRGGQSQTLSLPESGKPGNKPTPESTPAAAAVAPAAEADKAAALALAAAPPLPEPPKAVTPPIPESSAPLPRRGRTRRSSEE